MSLRAGAYLQEVMRMNEIRALLKIAARRLEASIMLAKAHTVGIVLAAVGLSLIIADRLPATPFVPWQWVFPTMLVVGGIAAFAMWLRSRPSEHHVALLVDERLDLREKISTALHVGNRDDAFARAAVEDAVAVATDPKSHERARRRFNVTPPTNWWIAPMLIAVAVLISFIEPMDVFAREQPESQEVIQARHEVSETLDAVMREIESQPQLSGELADLLGDLGDLSPDRDTLKSPDDIRRDAIKRVTDLNERLEEIVSGERGKTMDAIDQAMKQMRVPEDGPAKELAEAMAQGDFQAASEALKELIEKVEAGELTAEQQEQLVEQLKDLAKQLEDMARQQQQLEDALRKAGMDPQLAQNPEALKQAIENNQNLNEQQRQQLQQVAQAQQASSEMCQGLGAAAMALAQALESGQMGDAAGQMSDQLSELEQLQMLLQQAQAAASMCQGTCQGLGRGLGLQAAMQQWGQGMGAGGAGGPRPTAPSPTRTREVRAEGQTGEGDIIARMLVDGPQTVGESRIVPSQVLAEVVEGFEEGIDEDQLPRKYHEAQKRYFGELERQVREAEAQTQQEE